MFLGCRGNANARVNWEDCPHGKATGSSSSCCRLVCLMIYALHCLLYIDFSFIFIFYCDPSWMLTRECIVKYIVCNFECHLLLVLEVHHLKPLAAHLYLRTLSQLSCVLFSTSLSLSSTQFLKDINTPAEGVVVSLVLVKLVKSLELGIGNHKV